MHDLIEPLQEGYCLEIFAPPELVRDPLARPTRVVQVEHRGDGIHAQTVHMILIKPEQRAGKQEGAYLVAPVIVNQGAPILLFTLARVRMLIKVGAVEEGKPVRVFGEMGWNPIHYDPKSALMSLVYKVAKIVGRAEERKS